MAKPVLTTLRGSSARTRFGKVAVMMGGVSAEREISLMSGSMVLMALNRQGVHAFAFDPADRSLAELVAGGYERVFIALHGRFGEDGTVQGALEMLRVPYTGAGVMASSIAIDKVMTKRIWQTHQLPTPAFEIINSPESAAQAWQSLGGPCVVKPFREGSTLGLSKVMRAADMTSAWRLAAGFHDDVMAEQCIVGRELTVSIIGTGDQARALPVIEIKAPSGNYDYQHKYFTDDTEYLCPAPLSAALTEQIQAISLKAYHAVGCEGWARVDFMLDQDDKPWLLEINTSPGMTDHSLVPMAAAADGISYDELVAQILATASLKVATPDLSASGLTPSGESN
ncbi:MAG: D-alanine--D-alanine ligase [Burkholderiaceae bacterium]